MAQAEILGRWWKYAGNVKIGGPALGQPSGNFIAGRYLKPGYTITSRGCPNKCWFCSVWRREGTIRELPIVPGHNILDDNLLACSDKHITAVFEMLKKQAKVQFTGGLEAARLKAWHVDELKAIKPKQVFFAYDTANDYEPLVNASKLLRKLPKSSLRCYVLIGYPQDSFQQAEKRLRRTVSLGFLPMAMLWRNDKNETTKEWRQFQRLWARPASARALSKQLPQTKNC
jgi:hypothetical protein